MVDDIDDVIQKGIPVNKGIFIVLEIALEPVNMPASRYWLARPRAGYSVFQKQLAKRTLRVHRDSLSHHSLHTVVHDT